MNTNHPNRGPGNNPARNPTADDWQRVLDHVGGKAALLAKVQHRGISERRLLAWIDDGDRCHPATFAYILAQAGLLALPEDSAHGKVLVRRQHAPVMQSGPIRYQLVPVQQVMPGDRVLFATHGQGAHGATVDAIDVRDKYVMVYFQPGDHSASIPHGTMLRIEVAP